MNKFSWDVLHVWNFTKCMFFYSTILQFTAPFEIHYWEQVKVWSLLIRYITDCYLLWFDYITDCNLLWFDSVTVTKPSPEDRESVRHVSAEKSASSRRRKRCSSPSLRRSPQHQARRDFCVHIDLIVLTINLCGKIHHVYTSSNVSVGSMEIVETLALSTRLFCKFYFQLKRVI